MTVEELRKLRHDMVNVPFTAPRKDKTVVVEAIAGTIVLATAEICERLEALEITIRSCKWMSSHV